MGRLAGAFMNSQGHAMPDNPCRSRRFARAGAPLQRRRAAGANPYRHGADATAPAGRHAVALRLIVPVAALRATRPMRSRRASTAASRTPSLNRRLRPSPTSRWIIRSTGRSSMHERHRARMTRTYVERARSAYPPPGAAPVRSSASAPRPAHSSNGATPSSASAATAVELARLDEVLALTAPTVRSDPARRRGACSIRGAHLRAHQHRAASPRDGMAELPAARVLRLRAPATGAPQLSDLDQREARRGVFRSTPAGR